jgi:hypothetical protein
MQMLSPSRQDLSDGQWQEASGERSSFDLWLLYDLNENRFLNALLSDSTENDK